MTDSPELILGYDMSTDDIPVVVLARNTDGTWQVESTTGGTHADELADVAAAIVARHRPPLPAPAQTAPSLAEQVTQWIAEHPPESFTITDEQRDLIRRAYTDGLPHLHLPALRA